VRVRTRADRAAAERATDREVGVVAAVLVAGSEKAAAHLLGLSVGPLTCLTRISPPGTSTSRQSGGRRHPWHASGAVWRADTHDAFLFSCPRG